jgi:hypothetical protein
MHPLKFFCCILICVVTLLAVAAPRARAQQDGPLAGCGSISITDGPLVGGLSAGTTSGSDTAKIFVRISAAANVAIDYSVDECLASYSTTSTSSVSSSTD